MKRGMGRGPMLPFVRPLPLLLGAGLVVGQSLASLGLVRGLASSGLSCLPGVPSRSMASALAWSALALVKLRSLCAGVMWVSASAAGPARRMSGEAGERSEPNLFIGHFGTRARNA